MDINWSKIFFDAGFYNRLGMMARTSITDESVAEEAVTFVIGRISENNWERCRAYNGRSAPETYLHSICSNLIVDYSRKVYGRERPPAWLKQKGETWLAVWKELCLDRDAPENIISRITRDGFKDIEAIKHIISMIKAKLPWCGVSLRPVSTDDPDDPIELPGAEKRDVHEDLDAEILQIFAHYLLNGPDAHLDSDLLPPEAIARIQQIVKSIELTTEQLLILRMYFCDAVSGAKIAKVLNIPNHQPVRLIKAILDKARDQLSNIGMDLAPA